MSARLRQWYFDVISSEARGIVPTLSRFGLLIASLPYGLAVRGRNWLFERGWKTIHTVDAPVVSVGNLTVGGTGKTPMVEYVARFYRELDRRVAILSRGYGQSGRNDEALVLDENLPDVPHLQGADRVSLARIALEELESEILVLDDGFQHRRLGRNLDVVLVDAMRPWGYGHVLPRGLLREPTSGLRRADVVVLTRCDAVDETARGALVDEVLSLVGDIPVIQTRHRPTECVECEGETLELSSLGNGPVASFSGIGNPAGFAKTLEGLGLEVVTSRDFGDHHSYSKEDVEELNEWASRLPDDATVLTTQKDLVKIRLRELGGKRLWAVRIRLDVLDGEGELQRVLRSVCEDQRA